MQCSFLPGERPALISQQIRQFRYGGCEPAHFNDMQSNFFDFVEREQAFSKSRSRFQAYRRPAFSTDRVRERADIGGSYDLLRGEAVPQRVEARFCLSRACARAPAPRAVEAIGADLVLRANLHDLTLGAYGPALALSSRLRHRLSLGRVDAHFRDRPLRDRLHRLGPRRCSFPRPSPPPGTLVHIERGLDCRTQPPR